MAPDPAAQELTHFDPKIPGLEGILSAGVKGEAPQGLAYYPGNGLNLVLHGPAGCGKTILALQMAMGAILEKKNVIFLTKDTSPETLLKRLGNVFRCFGHFDEITVGEEGNEEGDWDDEYLLVPNEPIAGRGLPYFKRVKGNRAEKGVSDSGNGQPEEYGVGSEEKKAAQKANDDSVTWYTVILDRLAEQYANGDLKLEEIAEVFEGDPKVRVFAVGSLGLLEAGEFDRYAANDSVYDGLARLCPRLRPVFEWLEAKARGDENGETSSEEGPEGSDSPRDPTASVEPCEEEETRKPEEKQEGDSWASWRKDFLVVCDSLPIALLEECLRAQSESPIALFPRHRRKNPVRALTLFVMESAEMPAPMTASFPPDVQMKLGFRDEAHGKSTRTIQILKARFQEVHTEPFPFVIHSHDSVGKSTTTQIVDLDHLAKAPLVNPKDNAAKRSKVEAASNRWHEECEGWKEGHPLDEQNPFLVDTVRLDRAEAEGLRSPAFVERRPGITIFHSLPSVLHESSGGADAQEREINQISFGCEIDELTTEKYFAGGGMTLLVTENRCNSTVMGLYFLLGEIGRQRKEKSEPPNAVPNSVLYIALENDLIGVLHDIWRYPDLRRAIFGGEVKGLSEWQSIEHFVRRFHHEDHLPGKHRLYKIPLMHPNLTACGHVGKDGYTAFLYILIPDLVWCTSEEALESLRSLLDMARHESSNEPKNPCQSCLRIDRVVLNRVSRVSANWPLVTDPTLLVSNLARLCAVRRIDLMIIDDTAVQSEMTGHIESRWQNIARNIVRLRRVPLHGTEVVGMELIRTSGTNVKALRPVELRASRANTSAEGDASPAEYSLTKADTFRGYTGIFSGKPQRCKTTVDLTYDVKGSPLYRDGMSMKRNLEGVMEDVTVNAMGPQERPGVNSALSNLSNVSHDTCHVVSVDEIWMHRLIRGVNRISGLVQFSQDELKEILPEHIRKEMKDEFSPEKVGAQYVTQSLTIASRKAGPPDAPREMKALHAIPFRHNWGVLAVSEFEDDLSKIVGEKDEYPEEGSGEVYDFLMNPREVTPVPSWEKLARFGEVWNKTMGEKYGPEEPGDGEDKKDSKGGIHFFDFHRDTSDSIVSFFLELLLDCQDIGHLFSGALHSAGGKGGVQPDKGFLFFKTRDWREGMEIPAANTNVPPEPNASDKALQDVLCASFEYALSLMMRLLSDTQRREIALAEEMSVEEEYCFVSDPAGILHLSKPKHQNRARAVVSREWLTTVPRGGQLTEDASRHIALRSLPVSDGTLLKGWGQEGCCERLYRSVFFETDNEKGNDPEVYGRIASKFAELCEGRGITVSGTWYLGTMSGGNRELAADIIRELVSEYHEVDRFLAGSGGPVSRRFYINRFWMRTNPLWPKDAASRKERGVPYADVIGFLGSQKAEAEDISRDFLKSRIVFPFARSRIRSYTSISLVLNRLVRKVMRLELDKEGHVKIEGALKRLVAAAVDRIDDIHWSSLVSREDG